MALDEQSMNEIVVSAVLYTLTTIVIVLRFVARRVLKSTLNASDWLTALSWFLLTALVIQLFLWSTIGGNGSEMKALDTANIETFFKFFYANELTYFVLSPCIKLSLVYFVRGLFPVRSFRITTSGIIAMILAWAIAIILVGIFQCNPISTAWSPSVPTGHCINQLAFLLGVQYPNIVFDFVILILPIPVIWNIQRPTRDKLGLIGVFTLGGLGCISGIVRVVILGTIDYSNVTYTIYQSTIWTFVEPCVALMCGSLPVIRGLLKKTRRQAAKQPKPAMNIHGISGQPNSLCAQAPKAKSRPLTVEGDLNMGPYEMMEMSRLSSKAALHDSN